MTEEIKQVSTNSPNDTHAKTIYIKHAETGKTWVIPYDSAYISTLLKRNILDKLSTDTYGLSDNNPLIINGINSESISFIISYLIFYKGRAEYEPPEIPLKNIHISILLINEFPVFEELYNSEPLQLNKILKINSIIEAAEYFGMNKLSEKLCAMIAYIFKEMSIADIKKML